MKMVTLNVPSLAFVVATRALLGAGLGLLAAGSLATKRRRRLGTAFVGLGLVTTAPAIWAIRRGRKATSPAGGELSHDEGLRGVTRFPRKGDDQP